MAGTHLRHTKHGTFRVKNPSRPHRSFPHHGGLKGTSSKRPAVPKDMRTGLEPGSGIGDFVHRAYGLTVYEPIKEKKRKK